jgi:hypothetical protein
VALGQLALTVGVVAFRSSDESGDGVQRGLGVGSRCRLCRRGRRGGRHLWLSRAAAATGAAEKNQATQPSHTGRSNHRRTPFRQDHGGDLPRALDARNLYPGFERWSTYKPSRHNNSGTIGVPSPARLSGSGQLRPVCRTAARPLRHPGRRA